MNNDDAREVRHPETGEVWKIRFVGGNFQILSYKGPKKKIPKHLDGPAEIRLLVAMMATGVRRKSAPKKNPFSIEDYAGKIGAPVIIHQGKELEKEGKYEEALEKYQEAIETDKKSAKAWFHKFKTHYKLGQMDEAVQCARMAIEIEPKWMKFIKEVDKDGKLDEFF